MLVVFVLGILDSGVAINIAHQMSNLEGKERAVQGAYLVSLLAGIILYGIASFTIQQYDNTRLDFWSHGKITAEGVVYVGMEICGVIIVIETFLDILFMVVKDIKKAIREGSCGGHLNKSDTSISSAIPVKAAKTDYNYNTTAFQEKVPAWKQVEMEKQNKQD